ncbi:spore germination protein [Paenibacillus camerounensis]|uniref:spore germination protein n=1 Tax=Paenibacillus camerounensis TaxID=1243663 RepID=UPI0005AB8156|nr:spore germination protein [Paenibacillus camerounensis]
MRINDKKSSRQSNREEETIPLSKDSSANAAILKKTLGDSSDLTIRCLQFNKTHEGYKDTTCQVRLVYLDGMVDNQVLQERIIPAIQHLQSVPFNEDMISIFSGKVISAGQVSLVEDFQHAVRTILSGCLLILIDGYEQGLTVSIQGYEKRGIEETKTQTVIRGPQEGFTEDLRTNITMIRRKMKDERLRIDTHTAGRMTQTDISVMYIDGMVKQQVLDQIWQLIDHVSLKTVLEGEYIEEYLQSNKGTIFPTVLNTERPDSVTAALAEGRVALFIDGSPFAMIVPAMFLDFIQSAEDSYQPYVFSSFIRILRLIAGVICLTAPAIYIAITTYHQDLLPTQLLLSLMFQREGVPFPAFVEAILMEITFEIIREAGIRMPRNIGQAVSIVGTIVVGQAAVDAGFVSAAMVIVVAITGISSFVIPAYNMSIAFRLTRFLFMGIAASFGIYGLTIGFVVLAVHLCSLQSMGQPYMRPYAPYMSGEQIDGLIRAPYWLRSKLKGKKDKQPV